MKKPLTILWLVLVCAGCVYMGSMTKEVIVPSEYVHGAEEFIAIASEESPKEDGEAGIVVETDIGQHSVEEIVINDTVSTEEIAAEESAVTASGEPTEEGEADIAVETDKKQGSMEETTAEETLENVETAATTEKNKLYVGLAREIYEETNKERVAAGLPELE